ncbi:hypothetical protein CCHL11_02621, partial [Colletotrichum chlorophyti]
PNEEQAVKDLAKWMFSPQSVFRLKRYAGEHTCGNQSIRDLTAIASIRAIYSRNLKAHTHCEHSNNERIRILKTISANQLESSDLGIKTATTIDLAGLRPFAKDWELRRSNGAILHRNPVQSNNKIQLLGIRTYGPELPLEKQQRHTTEVGSILSDYKAWHSRCPTRMQESSLQTMTKVTPRSSSHHPEYRKGTPS